MHKYDDGGRGGVCLLSGAAAGRCDIGDEIGVYKYPALKSSSNASVPWHQSCRAHNQPTHTATEQKHSRSHRPKMGVMCLSSP